MPSDGAVACSYTDSRDRCDWSSIIDSAPSMNLHVCTYSPSENANGEILVCCGRRWALSSRPRSHCIKRVDCLRVSVVKHPRPDRPRYMPLNSNGIGIPCDLAVSLLNVVHGIAFNWCPLCINQDHKSNLRVPRAQLKSVDKTDPPCRSNPCSCILHSDLLRRSAFITHYSTGIPTLPGGAIDAIL